MDRLIAVPSEKFRVWSCWLSMVGEEVHEWRHWLLSQIDLVLRMNEIMMEIELKEKKLKGEEEEKSKLKEVNPEVEEEEIKDETLEKEDKQTAQQAAETDDGTTKYHYIIFLY